MTAHVYDARTRAGLDRPESRKWSLYPGHIGAWVAEMDFGTAPVVTEALERAILEENLGYLSPTVNLRHGEAVVRWLSDAYDWDIAPTHVHAVSDVMAALGVAVTHFSAPGSPVIVPTPAYMPFLTYLPTRGHPVIQVPGIVEDGRWRHDLDAIDRAFADGARSLVLCNPHNPTGTVLSRAELESIAEIVERRDGRVFADEIHAPLRYDGHLHVPYASLSPTTAAHTITGTSASKAWNIPGLKSAQLITSNAADAQAYERFGFSVVHGASTLGVIASTAAYDDGRPWLADTLDYLDGNRRLLDGLLAKHLPDASWHLPESTYLGWIDTSRLGIEGSAADFFRERARVILTDGALCGTGAQDFVRFVFAMPQPILIEAVTAMGAAVRKLQR